MTTGHRTMAVLALATVATLSASTLSGSTATGAATPLPTPVRQFLAGGFGHPSPAAPTQNRLFTQLVGVWGCAFLFAWLQQETTDGGQTWDTDVHIACRRRYMSK